MRSFANISFKLKNSGKVNGSSNVDSRNTIYTTPLNGRSPLQRLGCLQQTVHDRHCLKTAIQCIIGLWSFRIFAFIVRVVYTLKLVGKLVLHKIDF